MAKHIPGPLPSASLKLSFVTRICPEWTIAAIIDAMKQYGYDAVELRMGEGHLHKVELDSDKVYMNDVRRQFDDANLAVSCLATPLVLSIPDPINRKKVVEKAKQYLDLADGVGAPYVSIFGGDIPAGLEPPGVIDYICEALDEICTHAENNSRAMVLMETHDAFSHSKYLREVTKQVYSRKLGVLWDVVHPIRVLETVDETYEVVCEQVRHIHVHDFAFNEDRTQIAAASPGTGFVPFQRIVEILKGDFYRGYMSVEVAEKDPDPDTILPAYGTFLRNLITPPPKA